jgi:hypothetical protein
MRLGGMALVFSKSGEDLPSSVLGLCSVCLRYLYNISEYGSSTTSWVVLSDIAQ